MVVHYSTSTVRRLSMVPALARCFHWHKMGSPDLRDFDLNGVFLSPQRSSLPIFLILCVFVHFAITAPQGRWWRYLLIFIAFNIAKREKLQHRAEIFPKWSSLESIRGYGSFHSELKDLVAPRRFRVMLGILISQEAYLILIYCFCHSLSNAVVLLTVHVILCFILKNQLLNNTKWHVLCPLGLELEVFLVVLVTQVTGSLWGIRRQ